MQLDRALYRAFYARTNTRPLVGFFVGSYYPLQRYPAAGLPAGCFDPQDIAISDLLVDYERIYQQYAACPGDLAWTACPLWAVPWMEAALGCSVEADHVTGSCRSHPLPGNAYPEIPTFSLDNLWVARCLEMLEALVRLSDGRFPVGVTLMRGVSDLLAALLGLERTIYAMLDEPAQVHALAEQIVDFWIAFGQAQLDVCTPYQDGYGAFLYNLWAPGRCLWLQEDAAALLSPDLFERFILPHDRRIAQAFEYCGLHMHPARYIPYEPLLDTDLSALELHLDKGGQSARELLSVYRDILECKPLLIWGEISEDDLAVITHELDPAGLALQIGVKTPEQAQDIYRRWFA